MRGVNPGPSLPNPRPDGEGSHADDLRRTAQDHLARAAWHAAAAAYGESAAEARKIGDPRRLTQAEAGLGAVAFQRGDFRAAEFHYAAARAASEAADSPRLTAQIDNNEGALHSARGDAVRAEALFRRALERFDRIAEGPFAARASNNLGLALAAQSRFAEAELAYRRAGDECTRRGDAELGVQVMINRARLALLRGLPIEGHSLAKIASTLAEGMGEGPILAGAFCLMGEADRALGDGVGATYWFRRALTGSASGKAPLIEAETWVQIGWLYLDQGEPERAAETWQYARQLYRALDAHAEVDRLQGLIEDRARPPAPAADGAAEVA